MHNILSPVPMINTLDRAPHPATAPRPTAYSPTTSVSLQSEEVPPSRPRLVARLRAVVRSVARALRYSSSLSERTIERVDTAQLLRRR